MRQLQPFLAQNRNFFQCVVGIINPLVKRFNLTLPFLYMFADIVTTAILAPEQITSLNLVIDRVADT